ncbi:hypothetical protein EJ04DRAFT_178253 [Polyplosphaeria fusca]|uniref:Uncharacterized protein n=1 Tax=Polyplosphaeria fusca TaxID=682080 RepID=A0A9P4R3C3_9PLEO|nr:hypothetical protein EJ04DRAFT_178253 [Polyplosphaeria fusca]
MANFDSNVWYQLYVNNHVTNMSMVGSNLFTDDGLKGSVYFNKTNTKLPKQRWQIFGINSTTVVMRSEEGGPDAYFGAMYSVDETTPGQTRGLMVKNTIADLSVFWTIGPWGDGTFHMSNGANGTQWQVEKMGSGLLAMSSNLTVERLGQRWTFEKIGEKVGTKTVYENIDNTAYSTINLQSATVTSSKPLGSSTGSDPETTPKPSTRGLTAGQKAGIGVSVALAFIIIAAIVFLLWRRKRQNREALHERKEKSVEEMDYEHLSEVSGGHEAVKYEMYYEPRHELHNSQIPAAHIHQPPVELPNSQWHPNAR